MGKERWSGPSCPLFGLCLGASPLTLALPTSSSSLHARVEWQGLQPGSLGGAEAGQDCWAGLPGEPGTFSFGSCLSLTHCPQTGQISLCGATCNGVNVWEGCGESVSSP